MPPPLPPEVVRLIERELPADEFLARVGAPISADELAEVAALVRWFTRRYPTVADRLRYVRQAHARWTRQPG